MLCLSSGPFVLAGCASFCLWRQLFVAGICDSTPEKLYGPGPNRCKVYVLVPREKLAIRHCDLEGGLAKIEEIAGA